MALTLKKPNLAAGTEPRVPIREDVAQEALDFVFTTRAWWDDPDALIDRVHRWKQKIFAVEAAPAETATTEKEVPLPQWQERAVRMKGEGASLDEIVAAVGQPANRVKMAIVRAAKVKKAGPPPSESSSQLSAPSS